ENEAFHRFIRFALRVTNKEDVAMPRAAAQGVMVPAIARGIAMALYKSVQPKFCQIMLRQRLANAGNTGNAAKSCCNKYTPAAWRAKLVELAGATDTSASKSAGASLIPSPTIICEPSVACNAANHSAFSLGVMSP